MNDQRNIDGPLKVLDDLYLTLPVGDTARRNVIQNPENGMIRFNKETNKIEYYRAVGGWDNLVGEKFLLDRLKEKVSISGDLMTGQLTMDANIAPKQSNVRSLGDENHHWLNLYAETVMADVFKNPSDQISLFYGDLKGNADTASKWKDARNLTITGDGSGMVVVDGSNDIVVNLTNNVATRWRTATSLTLSGDVTSIEKSFDGQANQVMDFNLEVNRATAWRNAVKLTASGNIELSSDVTIKGDEGVVNLPVTITSVPDSILRNHYVWKHGDTMDGPLTMDNAAIYSEWNQDLVITSRQNLALTAAYGGYIDMQSDGDINIVTPAIVRVRTNNLWQVGNGAFQMARGHTLDRPEPMYTDIGMIRWNTKTKRFEAFTESQYPDPDPDVGHPDPNNPSAVPPGTPTGWTGLVTDDDLRDNALIKQLIGIQPGAIIMWAGTIPIPYGWALCDGSVVNGYQTPDLRDRFIVGAGLSYAPGTTGGENFVTLTVEQMPAHSHEAPTAVDPNIDAGHYEVPQVVGTGYTGFETYDYINSAPVSSTGGGAAHENRPPFYALTFVMRVI